MVYFNKIVKSLTLTFHFSLIAVQARQKSTGPTRVCLQTLSVQVNSSEKKIVTLCDEKLLLKNSNALIYYQQLVFKSLKMLFSRLFQKWLPCFT